jgi:hypothetical protein
MSATGWSGLGHTKCNIVPLPGIQPEALHGIDARWQGFLTGQMRQLLQSTCGLSGTPIGSIDFTGCWYPEEPLPLFRPCITLAIDDEGRRWIAEAGRAGSPMTHFFVERDAGRPSPADLGASLCSCDACCRRIAYFEGDPRLARAVTSIGAGDDRKFG